MRGSWRNRLYSSCTVGPFVFSAHQQIATVHKGRNRMIGSAFGTGMIIQFIDTAFSHKDCSYITEVMSRENPVQAEEVEVDAPAPPVTEGSVALDDTLPVASGWESVVSGGSPSHSFDHSSRSSLFFCALFGSGFTHSSIIFFSCPCPIVFCITADRPVFLASGLLRSWFEVFVVTIIVMMKAADCGNGKVHGGTC